MTAKNDPSRSLALLWGSHTTPGRSGLTVRSIVTAATAIADAEGLAAATMRRVADRLGVGTMSLYTHVPGRAELTELMIDIAYGELYADVDEPAKATGGWREGLRLVGERNWDLYQRHPWLLQATGARPVLGPHATLKYEAELRPLDGIGLTDVQMDSVLTLVLTHVEGVARIQADLARTEDGSGMSDQEWWLSTAPALEKVMDASRFPTASRVGQAAGEHHQASVDPAHAFRFGLARILDGVERLIEEKSPEAGEG
ncbi:TetR/AcrR family transcriptional regulator [Rugosimonospora africana]|uniref:TetR family transcriptional regulator n=1 Tax=Rugosimonospora africana TaxID=556532 RepID=A0A8J3QXF2_9ACTN|nr:TetR family transcriptional regulator [Rugosimonospora africana]